MAKYKYSAVDVNGGKVAGTVEAESLHGVTTMLLERGLRVAEVREQRSVLQFEITAHKVKLANVMHFSRQLAAFVRAGVPLLDGLQIVREETTDKTLRKVIEEVEVSLRAGESFTRAMSAHAEAFPSFYVSVLSSAELTGRLDHVLDQLSRYIERDLEARRKIKSALAYPLIIMLMSFVTVGILAGFVLPRFKKFFLSLHAELPLPTRMLLSFTDFITAWWPVVLGGLVVFVLLIMAALRTHRGREIRDAVVLKIPVVGSVVRYAIVERFCRVLASMVETGVPLPEALRLASIGTHNLLYERALAEAQVGMLQGDGIARPIARTGLFPSAVVQMMRVGEDTGTLDDQLESMATYYERELDYKLKKLTTIFEPAAIVFMGLVVGFVAVALVSAMYGVFNQVQIK